MSPVRVTRERIDELVHLVGLTAKLDQKIVHLSGGMKRKVNIILSLLHDPSLLILDEPTAGIDIQSKLEINQFMKEVCSHRKSLFFSSHDLQEIQQLASKVVYLDNGRLLFYGSLQEAISLAHEKKDLNTNFSLLFKSLEA